MKKLLLGNAAVARGAFEAGVNVVASYPGTPSTEITEEVAKYDEIYSCFLGKITDYKFASLPADDAYDLMKDWLHSSIAQPYIRRIFSSIIFSSINLIAEVSPSHKNTVSIPVAY